MTGATILGCAGPDLGPAERDFFRAADPFGFILFARNVESPDQVRRLTDDLRAAVGRDAPVFVDQEGGRVQRLRAPHWREWAAPLDTVAAAGDRAGAVMRLRARIIAAELRGVGIDGNCAPIADIAQDGTHAFLKNRCYGSDLQTVVHIAREVAAGLLQGGVLPVMKHLPGHGRATLDTHLALPRVTEGADVLRATDFAAFAALADLPLAMTAHIVFAAFDDAPATASRVMVDLIRHEIGFDGLLMTDDLSMEALSGTLADRAAAARGAGCDVVLYCKGVPAEAAAVVQAAGRLDAAGVRRATAALACRGGADMTDPAALEADLADLMQGLARAG